MVVLVELIVGSRHDGIYWVLMSLLILVLLLLLRNVIILGTAHAAVGAAVWRRVRCLARLQQVMMMMVCATVMVVVVHHHVVMVEVGASEKHVGPATDRTHRRIIQLVVVVAVVWSRCADVIIIIVVLKVDTTVHLILAVIAVGRHSLFQGVVFFVARRAYVLHIVVLIGLTRAPNPAVGLTKASPIFYCISSR